MVHCRFYQGWVLLVVVGIVNGASYTCESTKQPVAIDELTADSSLVPPYPTSTIPEISVIIEAYRDSKCGETIKDLFKNAKHPDKLHIGVINHVQVESPADVDCISQYCSLHSSPRSACPRLQQIRTIIVNKREYRGKETALVYSDQLIGDSEFCMQLSPGISAANEWDASLVSQWASLSHEFAVLSSPLPLRSGHQPNTVPYSIGYTYNNKRVPRPSPATIASHLSRPLLSNTYTSEFVFGKCHMLTRVPHDPQLHRLDTSYTDALRFARLWSHGYDMYTWSAPVFFQIAVQAANDEWARFGMTPGVILSEFDAAFTRLKNILGMSSPMSISTLLSLQQYGLGSVRSLDELSAFMMVDLRGGVVYKTSCEQLRRVTYSYNKATQDPATDLTSIWGYQAVLSTSRPQDLISTPLSSIQYKAPPVTKLAPTTIAPTPYIPIWSDINALLESVLTATDVSIRNALHIDTPLMGVKIFLLSFPILLVVLTIVIQAVVVVEKNTEQVLTSYRSAKDT